MRHLPDSFRYKIPLGEASLSDVADSLRCMKVEHQNLVCGIVGDIMGLQCDEAEYTAFMREWERISPVPVYAPEASAL